LPRVFGDAEHSPHSEPNKGGYHWRVYYPSGG